MGHGDRGRNYEPEGRGEFPASPDKRSVESARHGTGGLSGCDGQEGRTRRSTIQMRRARLTGTRKRPQAQTRCRACVLGRLWLMVRPSLAWHLSRSLDASSAKSSSHRKRTMSRKRRNRGLACSALAAKLVSARLSDQMKHVVHPAHHNLSVSDLRTRCFQPISTHHLYRID
jgi:hypothetical protein